jgi:hypothetical protein
VEHQEIESGIKNLLLKQKPGSDVHTGKFYQALKEKLTSALLRPFQKLKKRNYFHILSIRQALF